MSETNATLAIMAEGWQHYQDQLIEALAPLSPEQLALRAAPNLRSVDELARHIIGARVIWFHHVLGLGDDAFAAYAEWRLPDSPPRTARELVSALAATWGVLWDVLPRFTPTDLRETVTSERWGEPRTFTRGWIIWHVLEHDLHHGGEIGYSLGMHGLTAPDI